MAPCTARSCSPCVEIFSCTSCKDNFSFVSLSAQVSHSIVVEERMRPPPHLGASDMSLRDLNRTNQSRPKRGASVLANPATSTRGKALQAERKKRNPRHAGTNVQLHRTATNPAWNDGTGRP